jgi:hypothetical protein
MKTTANEYIYKSELKSELARAEYQAKTIDEDFTLAFELSRMIETLEKDYFSKLDTVNISFYIGSRSYYETAVKIGSKYFKRGKNMTSGRGYNSIEEIDKITDKMTESMISDSYYY